MSRVDLQAFKKESENKSEGNREFLNHLKRRDSRRLDEDFHRLHEEVFNEISCLECANCCRTTSPIFYQTDISRAAAAMGIKPGSFVEKFLRIDEDRDYVLKSSPCPFLGADNSCTIYDSRPKACREYPHTNRKRMVQVLDLAHKNSLVCPAVFEILERMKSIEK